MNLLQKLNYPATIRRSGAAVDLPSSTGIAPVNVRALSQQPKHLVYHLHPVLGSVWRQNIEELKRRIDVINGRRIIHVALGANTETVGTIERELESLQASLHFTQNNRELGETPTLLSALNGLSDLPGMTFYAHAKGVTHWNATVVFDIWARLMYTLLDRMNEVTEMLTRHGFCGLIRSAGQPVAEGQYQWYYPGSFYWFRNDVVRQRSWSADAIDRFFTEQFPSRVIRFTESAALYPEMLWESPYEVLTWKKYKPESMLGRVQQAVVQPPVRAVTGSPQALKQVGVKSLTLDSPPAMKASVQVTVPVAVIITSHNYGRFLQECIESVLKQTSLPQEIVVVDDSSSDNTAEIAASYVSRGVKYIRVEHRSAYLSRRAGLHATNASHIVFLDADDQLGTNYIHNCLAALLADESLGIVTTDLTLFGDAAGVLHHEPRELEWSNWIHAGSMVRRDALIMTEAYESQPPLITAHEDWFVWRRVVRGGWKVTAVPSADYLYRRHSSSLTGLVRTGSYYERAGLNVEPVTLVVPLCREKYFDRLMGWIEGQTQISDVLIIDSSDDSSFRERIKARLLSLPAKSFRYVSRSPSNGLPDADRAKSIETYRSVQQAMPPIYRHLRDVATEYIMIVEDDVLPPADAVDRLLRGMDTNVGAVSGIVPSRYQLGHLIGGETLDTLMPIADRTDLQSVAFTGFGCLLLRKSAIVRAAPFHAGGRTGNFDIEFCRSVGERGLRWLLDWSVRCTHAELTS